MPVDNKIIKYIFNFFEEKKWIEQGYIPQYDDVRPYININQKDLFELRPYSSVKLDCTCDHCHESFSRTLSKLQVLNSVNFTLCNKCRLKYRYENNKLEKARRELTNLKKFGYKNPMQNKLIQQKYIYTVQSKYGKQYTTTAQIPEVRQKQIKTLCMNQLAPLSKPQKHIHTLIGGELNYPFEKCIIDIAFPNERIAIEYDGSGHDLSVKLGKITKNEFLNKEKKRNYFILNKNWKIIHIIAQNDKLLNDNDLIKIINFSKNYIINSSNHWLNIYLEENRIECSSFVKTINEIIKE